MDKKIKKLKEEDLSLWEKITSTIQPLIANKKFHISNDQSSSESSPPEKIMLHNDNVVNNQKKITSNFNKLKIKKNIEYTGIDRRTNQKMTRGNVEIEANLDLHGYNQIEAYDLLYNFLVKSHQEHLKLVLVITGKGRSINNNDYNQYNEVGILKTKLPIWLKEHKFFNIVNGYRFSHQKHGGAGAYYILLKSK